MIEQEQLGQGNTSLTDLFSAGSEQHNVNQAGFTTWQMVTLKELTRRVFMDAQKHAYRFFTNLRGR